MPIHLLACLLSLAALICCACQPDRHVSPAAAAALPKVDGQRCMDFVQAQLSLGPRIPGSAGSRATAQLIADEGARLGLQVRRDSWQETVRGIRREFCNLHVCTPPRQDGAFILIISHYDTKDIKACPDFLGANDGASSTALLMQMMGQVASLPKGFPQLRFTFLDGEEATQSYSDADGLHGSRRHARQLFCTGESRLCLGAIVLDMIGDRDLLIGLPSNGDPELASFALNGARELGLQDFIHQAPNGITDDHVPYLDAGIRAIDIIDLNYGPSNSYWHTAQDSIDKLSPASMHTAGLLAWYIAFRLHCHHPELEPPAQEPKP